MEKTIKISFRRESICMGDDAGNGEWIMEMPEDASLKDLIHAVLYGGYGNGWPIPSMGEDTYWEIQSNVGTLAYLSGDKKRFCYPTFPLRTPLRDTGITSVFGAHPHKEDIIDFLPRIT